jgi:hypothetical protein
MIIMITIIIIKIKKNYIWIRIIKIIMIKTRIKLILKKFIIAITTTTLTIIVKIIRNQKVPSQSCLYSS